MAEIKIPIKIDGFKCVEDMAQAVLNYTYKGKTLKEWADSISEPKTNADRIRAMSDEELAKFFEFVSSGCDYMLPDCPAHESCIHDNCREGWLDWLKQEADNG